MLGETNLSKRLANFFALCWWQHNNIQISMDGNQSGLRESCFPHGSMLSMMSGANFLKSGQFFLASRANFTPLQAGHSSDAPFFLPHMSEILGFTSIHGPILTMMCGTHFLASGANSLGSGANFSWQGGTNFSYQAWEILSSLVEHLFSSSPI